MCLFKGGRKIYKLKKKLNFESQSCSLLIKVIKKCRETALDPPDLTSKTFIDFHERRFGLQFCGEVLKRKIQFFVLMMLITSYYMLHVFVQLVME